MTITPVYDPFGAGTYGSGAADLIGNTPYQYGGMRRRRNPYSGPRPVQDGDPYAADRAAAERVGGQFYTPGTGPGYDQPARPVLPNGQDYLGYLDNGSGMPYRYQGSNSRGRKDQYGLTEEDYYYDPDKVDMAIRLHNMGLRDTEVYGRDVNGNLTQSARNDLVNQFGLGAGEDAGYRAAQQQHSVQLAARTAARGSGGGIGRDLGGAKPPASGGLANATRVSDQTWQDFENAVLESSPRRAMLARGEDAGVGMTDIERAYLLARRKRQQSQPQPSGDLPAFAQGGVVRHPTWGLVGENGPEAIVPLNPAEQPTTIPLSAQAPAPMIANSWTDDYLASLRDVANPMHQLMYAQTVDPDTSGKLIDPRTGQQTGFIPRNIPGSTSPIGGRSTTDAASGGYYSRPTYRRQAFADGGVVTEPTVALLGERGPEMVVPLGPYRYRGRRA